MGEKWVVVFIYPSDEPTVVGIFPTFEDAREYAAEYEDEAANEDAGWSSVEVVQMMETTL